MPVGPDDGCPSPRQVDDALTAHLPGIVLPLGHATGPTTLRLAVTTDAAGALRLDLTDPGGDPLLHRWLPAVERSRNSDCPALAETAALIVERYWHEVGYDVPTKAPTAPQPPPAAAPPPAAKPTARPISKPTAAVAETRAPPPAPVPRSPPRWWIGAAGSDRIGDSSARDSSASLAFTVERPLQERRIGLRVSGGTDGSVTYQWSSTGATTDNATLRQFPLRMGAYMAVPLGPGRLEPGIGVNLNVISASVTDMFGSSTKLNASPGVDAALGWALLFRPGVYLRALGGAGVEVPYHFVTSRNEMPFLSTPRFYLDFALELGFWFP
jgi:hypothetical protein